MEDYFWNPQFTFAYIETCYKHKARLRRALRLGLEKEFNYIYMPETHEIALLIIEEEPCEELV